MASRGILVARRLLAYGLAIWTVALLFAAGRPAQSAGTFDSTTEFFLCNQLTNSFVGPSQLKGYPDRSDRFGPDAARPSMMREL